jgi:hypothetical protein
MNCSTCGKPLGFYVPEEYRNFIACDSCSHELESSYIHPEEDEVVSMTLEEIEAHERAMLRYDYLGG